MKKSFLHLYIPFVLAWLITFLMASIFQTQMVLNGLIQLNIGIPISKRFWMTWHDLSGLLPTYGLVILVGLVIGFGIAKLVNNFTEVSSKYLIPIAGALTMLAILLAMQPILGVTLLAGARTAIGIMLQMVAGLLGGLSFVYIRKKINNLN